MSDRVFKGIMTALKVIAVLAAIYFGFQLIGSWAEEESDRRYQRAQDAYDNAYSEGYDAGYNVGFDNGFESGYDHGHYDGYVEGRQE